MDNGAKPANMGKFTNYDRSNLTYPNRASPCGQSIKFLGSKVGTQGSSFPKAWVDDLFGRLLTHDFDKLGVDTHDK